MGISPEVRDSKEGREDAIEAKVFLEGKFQEHSENPVVSIDFIWYFVKIVLTQLVTYIF